MAADLDEKVDWTPERCAHVDAEGHRCEYPASMLAHGWHKDSHWLPVWEALEKSRKDLHRALQVMSEPPEGVLEDYAEFRQFLQSLTCQKAGPFLPWNWAAVPLELSAHDCQLMWLAWCDGFRCAPRYKDEK